MEELEKKNAKWRKTERDKEDLEGELETLSQALFEVCYATPPYFLFARCLIFPFLLSGQQNDDNGTHKRADIEEEVKEAQLEKESLRSALRLPETEDKRLKRPNSYRSSPENSEPISPHLHPSQHFFLLSLPHIAGRSPTAFRFVPRSSLSSH